MVRLLPGASTVQLRALLPSSADAEIAALQPAFQAAAATGGPALATLTRRVLELVSCGRTNREIAGELFISDVACHEHGTALSGFLPW